MGNRTTVWKTSNTTMLAQYHASVRVTYTAGYSEATNTTAIGNIITLNILLNIIYQLHV